MSLRYDIHSLPRSCPLCISSPFFSFIRILSPSMTNKHMGDIKPWNSYVGEARLHGVAGAYLGTSFCG